MWPPRDSRQRAMKFPPGYVPGVGVPKPVTSRFGERVMRSMGWEKGQGLGRNSDGIVEAIQVKKKDDTVGVSAWCQRVLLPPFILCSAWCTSQEAGCLWRV